MQVIPEIRRRTKLEIYVFTTAHMQSTARITLMICDMFIIEFSIVNTRSRKPKGQSKIDNSETHATLGTQDTEQRQVNKTQPNTEN